jgi:hypothetical protein
LMLLPTAERFSPRPVTRLPGLAPAGSLTERLNPGAQWVD